VLSVAESRPTRVRFSELRGRDVVPPQGERLGTVSDGIVQLLGSRPELTGLLLRLEGRDTFLHLDSVVDAGEGRLRLVGPSPDMKPFERRPGEVLLERDVVGRAVIDVDGARLVKVDDIVFEREGEDWFVTAIVSEPQRTVGSLLGRLFGGRPSAGEEIPWGRVEPLVGHVPTAGLRPAFGRLSELRPADIADIVEQASHEEGEQILEAVGADPELEADVFEELEEDKQVEYLQSRSDENAAEVLAAMDPDHAADLILDLDQDRRKPILAALPGDQRRKVEELLAYGEASAGGLMNNEFVALPKTETVQSALAAIRERADQPQLLGVVFALDGERLAGSITLPQLLRQAPVAELSQVVDDDPVAVYTDADLPSIAVQMADYNLAALPVVDHEHRLLGVITYDDVLQAVIPDEWRWRGRAERAVEPPDDEQAGAR
jgi:CBS domain-containing protein/sporulation protein YlmC with PRC-barrel domain